MATRRRRDKHPDQPARGRGRGQPVGGVLPDRPGRVERTHGGTITTRSETFADLPALRNTTQTTGKLVAVDIPDSASGFAHRTEYIYLPPAWFAGDTPAALPVVMMVAGEFNTPADWIRSGDIVPSVDAFAQAHGGEAPILVFVDAGGRFNNDTECVDGPRGAAADHLTEDVRPYVVATFGASASASQWPAAGWSMGGTCAVDLTVMHPELFDTFVDIAGDTGPTAGTKDQTI